MQLRLLPCTWEEPQIFSTFLLLFGSRFGFLLALGLLFLLRRPVIQVVGDIVAISAFGELLMHGFGVRQTMTVGTFGDHLVLVLVAGDAGDVPVLGRAGGQQVKGGLMTGSAKHRTGLRPIGQQGRLMGLMAGFAIGLSHLGGMRLVALYAVGNHAVGISVAEITGDLGMFARLGCHGLARSLVTGETRGLEIAAQHNVHRLMRVVAGPAAFQFVVLRTGMTHAALWDVVSHGRAVPLVARLAIDLGFMRRPPGFNLGGLLLVAFSTVTDRQNRFARTGTLRKDGRPGPEQQGQSHDQRQHNDVPFPHSIPPQAL